MLEVEDLSIWYGRVQAVRGVSFRVAKGECVALIGNNGAGKTSILRCISGLVKPKAGSVRLDGQSLVGKLSSDIVRNGVAHIPEEGALFSEMTVSENLSLGALVCKDRGARTANLERVYQYFPILLERRGQLAGSLSGGERQMLAIARGLMSNPKLVMMDEPSLGLAPMMVERVKEVITRLSRDGITILLSEQHAYHALDVAQRAYVVETGSIQLCGTAQELLNSRELHASFVGISGSAS